MYRAHRPASREPRQGERGGHTEAEGSEGAEDGKGAGREDTGDTHGAYRGYTGEGQVTLCVYTEFW